VAEPSFSLSHAAQGSLRLRSVPGWNSWWILRWVADATAIVLLLAVAWSITHEYVRGSLFVWGDHPGQFMRLWYPLAHSVPESGRWLWGILSWNPSWYAGYPELQFYPPGTTLLGLALHFLTLGQLTPEQIYNLIPAIAFCLPLFTCYAFLRISLAPLGRLPSIIAGLTAASLAITIKPMWGGIDAVVIGLMGERLAFGFAPLVLLAGWHLVEKTNPTRLAIAAISLACLLLLHPFHAPAIVLATLLYALVRQNWSSHHAKQPILSILTRQGLWLAGWFSLAIGLVAWWMLPLLMRYLPYAAALARATPDQVVSWFDASTVEWLWLAALMALLLLAQRHPRVEATVAVLALLLPLIVIGILFNDRVLVKHFQITTFDPVRFMAEYYLALILLVGCAVGAATSHFLWRMPWLALTSWLVLILTLEPVVSQACNNVNNSRRVAPPSVLDGMLQHPAFQGYWQALRQDPTSGRVFFVSNYLFLPGEDGTITPTTLQSMTPYLTGREIIGGTFSHWSPVARWLWVGDPRAELLPAQVEHGDNQQIFGKSWEEITETELVSNLNRLNATILIVGENDSKALTRFEASRHFYRSWANDYFTIYHLAETYGEWIEAQGATARLVERTPRRWVIDIADSNPNATLLLKMSYYPLWRARASGQPLPITADAYGLQEITLPAGGPYTIEVVYREGWPEWTGLLISLFSLLTVSWLLYPQRKR
jgi:hypothetical protein